MLKLALLMKPANGLSHSMGAFRPRHLVLLGSAAVADVMPFLSTFKSRHVVRGGMTLDHLPGLSSQEGGVVSPSQRANSAFSLPQDALVRQLLHRFLTALWGTPLAILLFRNLQLRLQARELIFVINQNYRIFARMPSALQSHTQVQNYAWRYGAVSLYLAVALRDPQLLIRWMQGRMQTMSLFQHQRFFRTLAVTLRSAVISPLFRYRLSGLKIQVTGKISVTGNAMSRTYFLRSGIQGNAALSLRLAQGFTIVRTRTGCLGVWICFYF